MNEQPNIPRQTISADVFAEIKDVLGELKEESGIDSLVLPGDAAAALYEYLTCSYGGRGGSGSKGRKSWVCGQFVCYKHNPELEPMDGDEKLMLPGPGNVWSKPVARRVIQQFEDGLVVSV